MPVSQTMTRIDKFFRTNGFVVVRFPTNEPLVNMEGVLTVILDQVRSMAGGAPIPAFPQRGKEETGPQTKHPPTE